jgi:hypothetical protein
MNALQIIAAAVCTLSSVTAFLAGEMAQGFVMAATAFVVWNMERWL